jgi:hypothetical protein
MNTANRYTELDVYGNFAAGKITEDRCMKYSWVLAIDKRNLGFFESHIRSTRSADALYFVLCMNYEYRALLAHLSVSWAICVQYTPCNWCPTFIFILFSALRSRVLSGFFPSCFLTKILYAFLICLVRRHTSAAHVILFNFNGLQLM